MPRHWGTCPGRSPSCGDATAGGRRGEHLRADSRLPQAPPERAQHYGTSPSDQCMSPVPPGDHKSLTKVSVPGDHPRQNSGPPPWTHNDKTRRERPLPFSTSAVSYLPLRMPPFKSLTKVPVPGDHPCALQPQPPESVTGTPPEPFPATRTRDQCLSPAPLQSDGYAAYVKIGGPSLLHFGCWAPLL